MLALTGRPLLWWRSGLQQPRFSCHTRGFSFSGTPTTQDHRWIRAEQAPDFSGGGSKCLLQATKRPLAPGSFGAGYSKDGGRPSFITLGAEEGLLRSAPSCSRWRTLRSFLGLPHPRSPARALVSSGDLIRAAHHRPQPWQTGGTTHHIMISACTSVVRTGVAHSRT